MASNKQPPRLRIRWQGSGPEQADSGTKEIELSGKIRIGREANNEVVLQSTQKDVSRYHLELEWRNNQVVLINRSDKTPTYLNGNVLSPGVEVILTLTGEEIKLGTHYRLMIERADADDSTRIYDDDSTRIDDDDSTRIDDDPNRTTVSAPDDFTTIYESSGPSRAPKLIVRWQGSGLNKNDSGEDEVDVPFSIGRHPDRTILLQSSNKSVSRYQADVLLQNREVILISRSTTNPTLVNGRALKQDEQVVLKGGEEIKVANYTLNFRLSREIDEKEGTLPFCPHTDQLQPVPIFSTCTPLFMPEWFKKEVVSLNELRSAGMPMETTTYLTIGGGWGSFTWADVLVICGAQARDITAIGFKPKEPYGRYKQLCQNSQIPGHERLRSNSDSAPDNIWGWPGYAVREIWHDLGRGNLSEAGQWLWQICNESVSQTYTPKSEDVFNSVDREAQRIGWDQIWREGRVEGIRKTDDGRYVVLYSQVDKQNQPALMVANYLHLAVGYPGIKFLPYLSKYRMETGETGKERRVVNAYEEHEHIYQHLSRHGGTVLVQGRGIVASRIIQKLNEVRQQRQLEKKQKDVKIMHLIRSHNNEPQEYGRSRRQVEHNWEFQPFNWPKGTWTGPQRVLLEKSNPTERRKLLTIWAGTTTANRSDWRRIIKDGLREGWYEQVIGEIGVVNRDPAPLSRRIVASLKHRETLGSLCVDFIIDATGLESDIHSNPLLNDLVNRYQLNGNVLGRLHVNENFEMKQMSNAQGRMYASGIITLGGPFASVDTFLGLQYAALRSVDDLVSVKAPNLKKLNGFRSLIQWIRWATYKKKE